MKKGYKGNIEELTLANENFRQVLYTGEHLQLVLMSLKPGEEIGLETHSNIDQFFRFEAGAGKVIVNESEYTVGDGDSIIVPSGSKHNIINVSATLALKLYTIYAPPHHQDGMVRATRAEAIADDPEFEGVTTE
ncbi:MAG: cupin domain-containing protein [bacterium]|jgi:mannose-6-phosphate isomerase-like protein (cupin superfamily)|nr:cupin domain-containing protein [bacterium]